MAVHTVSQEEIQAFGDKLEAFGNSLNESEQRLLAEILLRAAAADADVEGHMMAISRSWPDFRKHVGEVLVQILEGMGTLSPYDVPHV
ncbi:MAG TPA: hypothetical protein VF221_12540 [Chloroflexota bacterium]